MFNILKLKNTKTNLSTYFINSIIKKKNNLNKKNKFYKIYSNILYNYFLYINIDKFKIIDSLNKIKKKESLSEYTITLNFLVNNIEIFLNLNHKKILNLYLNKKNIINMNYEFYNFLKKNNYIYHYYFNKLIKNNIMKLFNYENFSLSKDLVNSYIADNNLNLETFDKLTLKFKFNVLSLKVEVKKKNYIFKKQKKIKIFKKLNLLKRNFIKNNELYIQYDTQQTDHINNKINNTFKNLNFKNNINLNFKKSSILITNFISIKLENYFHIYIISMYKYIYVNNIRANFNNNKIYLNKLKTLRFGYESLLIKNNILLEIVDEFPIIQYNIFYIHNFGNHDVIKFLQKQINIILFNFYKIWKFWRFFLPLRDINFKNKLNMSFALTKKKTFYNHKKLVDNKIIFIYLRKENRYTSSFKFLKRFFRFTKNNYFSSKLLLFMKCVLFSKKNFISKYYQFLYKKYSINLKNIIVKNTKTNFIVKYKKKRLDFIKNKPKYIIKENESLDTDGQVESDEDDVNENTEIKQESNNLKTEEVNEAKKVMLKYKKNYLSKKNKKKSLKNLTRIQLKRMESYYERERLREKKKIIEGVWDNYLQEKFESSKIEEKRLIELKSDGTKKIDYKIKLKEKQAITNAKRIREYNKLKETKLQAKYLKRELKKKIKKASKGKRQRKKKIKKN